MKGAVYQVSHEFAVMSVPDPGPCQGGARLRTRGRGHIRVIVAHVLELGGHARVLSLPRDSAGCPKAVIAP
jgi:hypothetical protein